MSAWSEWVGHIHWPSSRHFVMLLMSFLATGGYAVLYQVPKKALVCVGLVGMGAFFTQEVVAHFGATSIGAAFAGGLFVATSSEWLARWMRMPISVFVVGGIVPLVPGSVAYATMREFVTGNYTQGLARGTETMLIASAISAGLVLAGTIVRLDRRIRRDRKHSPNG
jgi:uncharacterized membrane protein YjjB (DUF3815 family)